MYRYYTALLSAVLLINSVKACDVCGFAINSLNTGILPGFRKHFVALRWSERSFVSEHTLPAIETGAYSPIRSKEAFHTIDLWGRYNPHRRLQLFYFIPFGIHQRTEEQIGTERFYGPGDMSVAINHILLNTGDSAHQQVKHTLLWGGGIKLPTGKYGIKNKNDIVVPNMQLGTGSVDFLLNASYTIRLGAFGFLYEAGYRIHTSNRRQYRFGNRLNSALRALYWYNLRRSILMPHIGMFFEHASRDRKNHIQRHYTGGYMLQATAGIDIFIRNIGMGMSFMQPAFHYLARGFVHPRQQYLVQLTYFF